MITSIELDKVASYKAKATLKTNKKVNLVYGLNGSGKSTFSNYLHDSQNPKYLQCSNVRNGEMVLVYNQNFINDNFYQPDCLNGIFGLSKENKQAEVSIAKKTEELESITKDQDAQNTIITEQEKIISDAKTVAIDKVWEIKSIFAGGDRVLEYCLENLKGNKTKLYTHLRSVVLSPAKPTKTVDTLKEELNAIDGDTATKLSTLSTISIDPLSEASRKLLNEIIVGNQDSPVSGLIETLKNSDWVSTGLEYLDKIDGEECPFCQAKTITDELAKQITDYFDESYQEKVEELKSINIEYQLLIENLPNLESYKEAQYAVDNLAKLTELHSAIVKAVEENEILILNKIARPNIKVELKIPIQDIKDFNDIVVEINKSITEHNVRIDNVDTEKKRIKKEFWEILRYEYDQTLTAFETARNKANKIIDVAVIFMEQKSSEASSKKSEILQEQKSTVNIDEAIENIKQGLEDIGITDFSIAKHDNQLYRIVRSGTSNDVFTTLSEGEKMIISFLYFRELFKGKLSATEVTQKKIAVIDDPVSSLSHIFVYNIGRIIVNDFFKSNQVEQVFVLTHSLYFFYELTDTNKDRRKDTQNLFRLSKNDNGSSIQAMKYEEIQNDYQSYWSVINDDKQPAALIANCMRNILEYFFNFVQKQDLSNVVQIPALQANKYQAFVRYIGRESHSLGQNIIDFKEFNYNDFKEAFKLLFETAGYPEHYKKMSKI
ncbi:AAA family ATPase [Shewanella sp. MEBiC00475]|uniref:AAA family ATPase n=1 Tax=Shewanella sp. MEBiC00475 TaxID=2575361 RepID=UPI0010BFE82A|nr:AAA family ATPase [Shewanella sp. MEBiC00475]